MGIEFETVQPTSDESFEGKTNPRELAIELAKRKAKSVSELFPNALVIGADTIVSASNGSIIGKPENPEDAKRILRKLSGTTHSVISGICIIDTANDAELTDAGETFVTMKEMTDEEIEKYVSSGEAMGKAGAYAIQETGDAYVNKIDGSFNNVVGLPTVLLKRMLARMNWME